MLVKNAVHRTDTTVVERDHPQTGVNLTYIEQSGDSYAITDGGDQYTGLDRFGRVIDQNWVNSSTGVSVDRVQYGYDADGNVLYQQNLVDAVFSELYTYDSLNQLRTFERGTLNSTHTGLVGSATESQSWSPDALGNFDSVTTDGTTQTRTANQQNEITSISGAGTVSYDANGNLTADGSGNGYVYDAWNRLVAINNGSTTLASYSYDGFGRRITQTDGSTTTDLYYSNNWQVLEEQVGGVFTQAHGVWSPVDIDALVLRDQSSTGDGTLDQRLYTVQDADCNVTALVDTSGDVVERYAYDPYGAVSVLAPDWTARSSSVYNWVYLFQGKRLDAGIYDSRGRAYSPTLMRPLQADPLGLAPDANDYCWEGDNPANETDPSGLWKISRSGGAKASAVTQDNDTVRALANRIGLVVLAYPKWLTEPAIIKYHNGAQVSTVTAAVFNSDPNKWSNVALCPNQRFQIPNRMMCLWYGDVGNTGRSLAFDPYVAQLKELGFSVDCFYDRDEKTILNTVASRTKDKYLQGMFVVGHGGPTWFGTKDGGLFNYNLKNVTIYYSDVKNKLAYKLGAVILWVCDGDSSGGRSLSSRSGDYVFDGVEGI